MIKEYPSVEVIASMIDRFDCVIVLARGSDSDERIQDDARRLGTLLPAILVTGEGGAGSPAQTSAGVERYAGEVPHDSATLDAFMAFLGERGVARPLFWMAETAGFDLVLAAWSNAIRVLRVFDSALPDADEGAVAVDCVDLIIADSTASAARMKSRFGERISITVIADGGSAAVPSPELSCPIAIVATDIGVALDWSMLHALVHRLPGWEFHLVGSGERSDAEWQSLLTHRNVRDHGVLDPDTASALARRATAIVQPCLGAEPVSAEYLNQLERLTEGGAVVIASPTLGGKQFTLASSLDAFADNLRRARAFATLRGSAGAQAWLGQIALSVSTCVRKMLAAPIHGRLNILLLYDDRSTFTSTVREHLEAFAAYSRHSFHYMPATSTPIPSSESFDIDLSIFDAVICHYSVRLSVPDFLQPRIATKLARFHGLKLLFIQDEYDTTETARGLMERLGFDVVYTCVPPAGREYVYPAHRLPRVEFRSTLTGYVPLDSGIDNYALPMGQRSVRIAYRGRMLPYHYGMLGWEKYRIGVDVKAFAEARGVPVDIEVDDSKRIYGTDWYRFLGSARATLGTESGSNVFDFDGTVRSRVEKILENDPETSFDTVYRDVLAPLEAHVRMNQISPKIFEAARLRTALILFEGEYSGVVKPHEHYIPLRHDYSNIDEVLAALEDISGLQEMTERAHRDLIESGDYSYQAFVQSIDADIEARLLRGPRNRIYAAPALICDAQGKVTRLSADQAAAFCLFDEALTRETTRELASDLFTPPPVIDMSIKAQLRRRVRAVMRRILAFACVRHPLTMSVRAFMRLARLRPVAFLLRPVWRLTPGLFRRLVIRLISR